MKYPGYENCQPSRFDSTFNIPSGWQEKRLKFVASYNDEALSEKTDPDYEIEYVDISSVNLVNGITQSEALIFEEAPSRARRIVKDGDTIVSTVRTYLKAIAPIVAPPENMVVSTGFAVIRPKEEICNTYLSYFLQSHGFVESVVANSVGVSYPAINASDLVCIPIYFPTSIEEQQKVANFLDYKTQQINQLIEKKKTLIEKLNEQRIAIITQAVTKGLEKDAKMKPSGVGWLGDVPDNWDIRQLKFAISYNDESLPESTMPENKFLYVDVSSVNHIEGITNTEEVTFENAPSRARRVVRHGDTIVSTVRTYLKAIAAIIAPPENMIVSTGFCVVRPTDIIDSFYLSLLLTSKSFIDAVVSCSKGVSYPAINPTELVSISVAFPLDIKEQRSIADYVNLKTVQIDRMVEVNKKAINMLDEYRLAIITNAVTGKIDVRDTNVVAS